MAHPLKKSRLQAWHFPSGIARAFLCGGAAHLEDQIEEENEKELGKIKMGENNRKMRKCFPLAHLRLIVWLCPCTYHASTTWVDYKTGPWDRLGISRRCHIP